MLINKGRLVKKVYSQDRVINDTITINCIISLSTGDALYDINDVFSLLTIPNFYQPSKSTDSIGINCIVELQQDV